MITGKLESPIGNGTTPAAATPKEITFTEAPYSVNFRATAARGYEMQFTVRAQSEAGLVQRVNALLAHLEDADYKPLAPRAQSANAPTANAEPKPQTETVKIPLCGIHGVPMHQRQGKGGRTFWSCNQTLQNGEWCTYRPPKE